MLPVLCRIHVGALQLWNNCFFESKTTNMKSVFLGWVVLFGFVLFWLGFPIFIVETLGVNYLVCSFVRMSLILWIALWGGIVFGILMFLYVLFCGERKGVNENSPLPPLVYGNYISSGTILHRECFLYPQGVTAGYYIAKRDFDFDHERRQFEYSLQDERRPTRVGEFTEWLLNEELIEDLSSGRLRDYFDNMMSEGVCLTYKD
ncbi:hypothetical protein [Acetobacter sp.]|uniref:hypothetical protein n=1 Tax=Acetobacter sp. TaxID=440 RepID=UPI0025C5E911|nr:hypothetical protein [Acetobacter sp.]MCH4091440.1 hypothetical protein [Acetobacter sp.]MCI1299418.1 hypothetical protein [Acetobacter sp.]MCI1316992.1 hypothetical protein [Acetobacter sp.]